MLKILLAGRTVYRDKTGARLLHGAASIRSSSPHRRIYIMRYAHRCCEYWAPRWQAWLQGGSIHGLARLLSCSCRPKHIFIRYYSSKSRGSWRTAADPARQKVVAGRHIWA